MIEPTIFLGPPGTGKTTTLLDTVLMEMERGVPPDKIGFMTFTKRGVEEAITRASARFSLPRKDFRYFNTLHSAAFHQVGLSRSRVFTGDKIAQFGEAHGLNLNGQISFDDGVYTSYSGDDLILFLENYSRITLTPIEDVLDNYDYAIVDTDRAARIISALRQHKNEEGLFDFTDMIEQFIREDMPPQLEVLIIDEAQDLSELQWQMVDVLSRHVKRLYIAGDDDQTIFTWAGASERFIYMPGNVQVLNQSYRVPKQVHNLANRIIARIQTRRAKDWNPRDADGNITTLEGISKLNPKMLESGNVMMLGRTVKIIRQKFLAYCRHHGIPYRYFEAPSVKPTYAMAIAAWNDLQEGKSIQADQAVRIYDLLPSEGHGKVPGVKHGFKSQLKLLAEHGNSETVSMQNLRQKYGLLAEGTWDQIFVQIPENDVAYIARILANGYNILSKPNVHISTIHRVKGGEADTVILLSDSAKAYDKLGTNLDEEIRVFYTAVTRSSDNLVIVEPNTRHHFSGLFE